MKLTDILTPDVLYIMDVLQQEGFEARVAGGAVRDFLNGSTPKDIDLATTATPDRVMEIFRARGDTVVPTGLQHGTVTVIHTKTSYEITTLRRDIDSRQGRWADVEFVTSWEEDAARRDFTMNAMFMDSQGVIHDFFGGQQDLADNRVRFVGNPKDRIREDYLRILRFFRFRARNFGWANSDVAGDEADAISMLASGLTNISGERIWAELTKTLSTLYGYPSLEFMQMFGVLDAIQLDHLELNLIPPSVQLSPLAILVAASPSDCLAKLRKTLVSRYKVSREEREQVDFLIRYKAEKLDLAAYKRLCLSHPKDWVIDLGRMKLAMPEVYDLFQWEVPVFPVQGRDLIDRGMTPGPKLGEALRSLREVWIASDYSLGREALLDPDPIE